MQLAAERVPQKAAAHARACPVHTIEGDAKFAAPDCIPIYVAHDTVDMQPYRSVVVAGHGADFGVGGLAEIALMIEIEQLASFVVVEEQPFGVEQFQRVV